MTLATTADVQAALRALQRPDLAEALPDVNDLLQDASDLVAGHLWPNQVPDPIPSPIARVTAAMVAAVLTRPKEILPETTNLSADGFGVAFAEGGTSPRPFLTRDMKLRLRPYRSGMSSVSMSSERYC
ncbi:head-to-tail adaptor [Mycobacterium phage Ximenita]|uniref:Head-to-tail adaptor n=1 Tax=Mycobacterium phage Ximenita TaxID=2708633 RepID=A0A6G6XRQ6_9CAUD|nr:head-to-tail adaptor [Mycobacterium phage Ximenita]QIG61524.1 head-to-tail adaptor [Mycobacterium phage Ximenita]